MNELGFPAHRAARTATSVSLLPVEGLPLVRRGDDVAGLIARALRDQNASLIDGDIVVVAQKIVSKAEGRRVDLGTVEPSREAIDLADRTGKDPRLVELILAESSEVLRSRPGLIVVVHRLGFVLANAGIDQSNVEPDGNGDSVLLLPTNPDESCRSLRRDLGDAFAANVGVVINDSLGRAWRNGTVGTALGVAGLRAVEDLTGTADLFGRPLEATTVGSADEIAAAASMVQGQAAEARPVVVIRGLADRVAARGTAMDLLRPPTQDLFR